MSRYSRSRPAAVVLAATGGCAVAGLEAVAAVADGPAVSKPGKEEEVEE